MQKARGVTGRGFECVAECMAEVEECAFARLAFVATDNLGLGAAGMRDHPFEAVIVSVEPSKRVALEPIEKRGIAECAIFRHFGVSREQLAAGQRSEK